MLRQLLRWMPLVLLALLLAACGGSPTVAVVPGEIDFGKIPATKPMTMTVQVRNQGSGTLRLAGVRTSCGCTTADLSQSEIASGESAELHVTLDPQAHPGLYGPLMRIVYLSSNDPNQPELEIPVTVEVLAPEEEQS